MEVKIVKVKDPGTTNTDFIKTIKNILEETGAVKVVSAGGIDFNN